MGQPELGFRKWVSKVTEMLMLIELKIRNKDAKGLTEREEELWRVMHKLHYLGEFPLTAQVYLRARMTGTSREQSLFDRLETEKQSQDDRAETKKQDGIKVDLSSANQKVKKK